MPATKKKKRTKIRLSKKQKEKRKKLIVSATAVLLAVIVALVSISVSHTGRKLPNPLLGIDKEAAYGVDVSHHNGKINWKKLKNEVDFVIIRVGYRGYEKGNVCIDKNAEKNLKGANKVGIPVGVYFYTQAVNEEEAREEAKATLDVIKKYDISLPVFYDFEYPTLSGKHTGRLYSAQLDKKQNVKLINTFCKEIEDAGYQSGLYASSFMLKSNFKMSELSNSVYIWVADYNGSVTYSGDYDLWQFSDKGKVSGISKKTDENYWYIKK